MISVDEAETLLLENTPLFPHTLCDIEKLSGEILREDIVADRPLPPCHRITMDGIALSLQAWKKGLSSFPIEGCRRAGDPVSTLQNPNSCLEVMTGTVLPRGCDCVVPFEDIDISEGVAHLHKGLKLQEMQFVHREGSDHQKGDLLLEKGIRIQSPHCAILASVGKRKVLVSKKPKIAVISTGDELVDVDSEPALHQIRKSNPYALLTALHSHHFHDVTLLHLPDMKEEVERSLENALDTYDVIILSGGVSRGKWDYIPKTLEDLQVRKVFHRIRQKPGKPMWFGVSLKQQLVFALPGNPVAVLLCFHRFVLSSLNKALGVKITGNSPRATLSEDYRFSPPLTYHLPVKVHINDEGRISASPLKMNTSGDFSCLALSDGFLQLDEDREQFSAGESFPLCLWSQQWNK